MSAGNLLVTCDALQNETTYLPDAQGNVAYTRKVQVTHHVHDANDQLIETVWPDGSISRTQYVKRPGSVGV